MLDLRVSRKAVVAFAVVSAITASSNRSYSQSKFTSSEQCDQGSTAGHYEIGGFTYRLTDKVYSPDADLYKRIRMDYGPAAEIVDWVRLKELLSEFSTRREFIARVGIPIQKYNFGCGNVLVHYNNSATIQGMHFLMARHDGLRPYDWTILDSIGDNELHLGRWNHYGRVLIRSSDPKSD